MIVSLLLVSVSISTLTAWSLWLRGSNVVSRESDQAVPAFVKADLASLDQPRVLILRRDPDGSVRYEIRSHRGPILGDADVLPRSTPAAIESAISDLAAGRGGQEMRTLSSFAIRYVVTPDQDAQLAARLDSAAGLRRLAGESGGLWESAYPTALLRLVPSENANGVSVDPALPLPPVTGSAPALLWGQPDDGRWVATLDGAILPSVTTEAGSLQWQLPGSFAGSSLAISRDGGGHTVGIIMQMLIFALVVVMSLPRRREDDLQPDAEGEMLVMPS